MPLHHGLNERNKMTYSSACGTVVRTSRRNRGVGSNPNGRKDHLVIRRNTHYCGELLAIPTNWVAATKIVTIKQACELLFRLQKHEGIQVQLVTTKEWEKMQTKNVEITLQGSLFFVTYNGIFKSFLTRETAENYAKTIV